MSLNAPDLDDWTFQQIVNEAKRRIGLLCPEWTDHNVSDPGVTLIELFAWMTEMTLYRVNQVPEKNYLRFLEMLGVSLQPPMPAQTELRFLLSQYIEDREDAEAPGTGTLPARDPVTGNETLAATIRTEYEEAVYFSTDAPLTFVRPHLAHIFALPARESGKVREEGELVNLPDSAVRFRYEGRDVFTPEARQKEPPKPEPAPRARGKVASAPEPPPPPDAPTPQPDATETGDWDSDTVEVPEPSADSLTAPLVPQKRDAQRLETQNEFITEPDEDAIAPEEKPEDDPTVDAFPVFSAVPVEGDTLWFGFEENVSANIVELEFETVRTDATGMNENYPCHVWEFWTPEKIVDGKTEKGWERLEIIADDTRGFNAEGKGRITLVLPRKMEPLRIDNHSARWIRCRYTRSERDLPARPAPPPGAPEAPIPTYQRSPVLRQVAARTVGGTAPASNSVSVFHEEIGISDGMPGQTFFLRNAPLLPRDNERREVERLYVGAADEKILAMEAWTEVEDFAESGREDRHYTLDSLSGELRFGPSILEPDGAMRQYGKAPEKGATLTFAAYRIGGGVKGNVAANKVTVPKTTIPFIASITNPRPATGGTNQETLERAKMRARANLRLRERAVTGEDFEYLAKKASTRIRRAVCLPPAASAPGMVRLRLIPDVSPDNLTPLPEDLRLKKELREQVQGFLDERRLLTAQLQIAEPNYLFLTTDLSVVAQAEQDPELVRRRLEAGLSRFFHPTLGGADGQGWPFGKKLTITDLYAQIQAVQGVAFLLRPPQFSFQRLDWKTGALGPKTNAELKDGIALEKDETLVSRSHRIDVTAMTLTNQDAEKEEGR